MSSSLKPREQFSKDFHIRPAVKRVLTAYSNGSVPFYKMAAMPIYGKALKNLLLQNQKSFEAESWYISSGTQGLPCLFKWWSCVDLWPFYGKVKFAPTYICVWENVENHFLSMY